MIVTGIQDFRKLFHTPPPPSPQNILESNSSTEEQEDKDEPEDEDIEFYNYMSGDIYYEDDKNFVFPRIKVK